MSSRNYAPKENYINLFCKCLQVDTTTTVGMLMNSNGFALGGNTILYYSHVHLQRSFHRLQNFFNNILHRNAIQNSLDSLQRASPLHTSLVAWRRDDDSMRVDFPRCKGHQRRRDIRQAVKWSKGTTAISKKRGLAYSGNAVRLTVPRW